ncbi:hypothetical protein AB0M43_14610 [Longispora sp. NPDC051575]|uniref:hypothetical protein n=1 Tax=Longispora sp. NPDC051575 TaxID=3154943 RepID=UPI00344088B4
MTDHAHTSNTAPPVSIIPTGGDTFTLRIGAHAVASGDLEAIHEILTGAVTELRQWWTDPTHQPGEPLAAPDESAGDATELPDWHDWLLTEAAQEAAPDVSVTEFHRTDPAFWESLGQLLNAAQQPVSDAPPLLPDGAQRIDLLPLTDWQAMCTVVTATGRTVRTPLLTRRYLTPAVSGVDAAAGALAIIAAEAATAVWVHRA